MRRLSQPLNAWPPIFVIVLGILIYAFIFEREFLLSNEQDDVFVPQIDKICSSRGNRDFYQYTIYIEDNYFKSDAKDYPILGFFNSPDKTKSRYYIDTGTYYIATSNIDLYANMKDYDKLYLTISYRTE